MSGKFKNILIMSDIDGTFLGRHSRLVERNLLAVERFKAEGGLFTFNTGRTLGNLYTAIPEAGKIANAPASMANGCCFYDLGKREILYDYMMEPESAVSAARHIAASYRDIGIRVSTKEGFLADPRDLIAVENLKKIGSVKSELAPIEEWDGESWYKIVMIGKEDRLEQVRAELRGVFGGKFVYDRSGRHVVELHRADRTKASVIDTYRSIYAEEGRELMIYAVGDYENDIEMLMAADVGVCPENAIDSVRNICDLILSSNDTGVIADLIELLERAAG